MPRRVQVDTTRSSSFAKWLLKRLEQRGFTLSSVAKHTNVDLSYIHKVVKSYLPQYQQYKRLSFEKTVQIGEYLGDVGGALNAAGYADTYQAATAGDLTLRPSPLLSGRQELLARSGAADFSEDNHLGGNNHLGGEDQVEADAVPSTEEWPPELLEAMHYSRTLTPETQQYIYSLWREQARVYAAVHKASEESLQGSLQVKQRAASRK